MGKKRTLALLPQLAGTQELASQPMAQVRLSASAGTGKTQVLSARVLRLLLQDVKPESILCLTFTKAGAAEMADRIHERLGAWVTMPGPLLAKDLEHLGEDISPERREDARSLFAKVLDARGSGLRIQTIHSFCQSLLASFPIEAGLPPGFSPIEGREERQLALDALSSMVEGWIRGGREGDLQRLRGLARRLPEESIRAYLTKCAAASEYLFALPDGEGLHAFVRRALTGIDDIVSVLDLACDEGGFDRDALEQLRHIFSAWLKKQGTSTAQGIKSAEIIADWLSRPPTERRQEMATLRRAWLKADGQRFEKSPDDPRFGPLVDQIDTWAERLFKLQRCAEIAPNIADALLIGRAYAQAYADAKRAAGAVDFNDLIRSTVTLLQQPEIGGWIRYKLDQGIDHILVDEAQDTNAAQWDIVKALSEEFFAGAGTKADMVRTIFAVGDFKQAIFGFQGTDPRQFESAGRYFKGLVEQSGQQLEQLSLAESYRSSQPILDATDAIVSNLGWAALGLEEAPADHVSALKGSGSVQLWPAVSNILEGEGDTDAEPSEESWICEAELVWASQLARTIKDWTQGGLFLRNYGRTAEPGDIMVLVRSRGELARLIVSRLYQENVAVAGVDRLLLGAPIAVQDLLACMRFALQPLDDLSLAAILVSPLMGWSQDQLYDHAAGRESALWPYLRKICPKEELGLLYHLLAMADLTTPYQFLEDILSGPFQGRKKLIARLGEEVRDPVEELLNAALEFGLNDVPSLQRFIDWFDKGEVEIKRDPAKPENAVRIMTVHGAKGLQAPIVVLADATADPDFKRKRDLIWEAEDGLMLPLFHPKKDELIGPLEDAATNQAAREREEHWRLLYVAMTRAEEHLFVGGALKPSQQKNGMGEGCWHRQIETALQGLGAQDVAGTLVLVHDEPIRATKPSNDDMESWKGGALPDWALIAAPTESMPPKPLAPSALETLDDATNPPPSDALRQAAKRGILLHSLFERLPDVAPANRQKVADHWLLQSAGVEDQAIRSELIDAAFSVINVPEFEQVFGAQSLAEVPLAGVVNGRVVAGTVDRLLVLEDSVVVIDFKTGRRVPLDGGKVPKHHKAQMAAYAAVLQSIYPNRTVRAALLYTSGPRLIELSPADLEAFKPGFSAGQEELQVVG